MIALVGRPNSGKTTLFNWLTGSRYRAVNYPGATVECYLGKTHPRYGDEVAVIDTPGIYSLFPKSPDEEVTYRTLFAQYKNYAVEQVIVVVDATQWARQWPLIEQLQGAGVQAVLALTMADLVSENEMRQTVSELGAALDWPIVAIDGQLGGGVLELVDVVKGLNSSKSWKPPQSWSEADYQTSLNRGIELQAKIKQSSASPAERARERTATLDSILLHPVLGLALFFLVMTSLFSSIFWLADPFMGFVDDGFASLGAWVLSFGAENLLVDLMANGVIAAFGSVLVFVPQIFILFVGISFLEDSGYLARAATLVDRPLSLVGLSGKSFVPLLSGYACAVPAMMATRNITSVKERWIAMFVIPLMSCSARLPVYALLLSFLFYGEESWKPGLVLAGLYLGSIIVGSIAAYIVSRLVDKSSENSFLMELPLYRRPSVRVVLTSALMRTKAYVRRAGPVIFVLAILVWGGSTFPRIEGASPTLQLEKSWMGQAGRWVEPIFEPMGSDWRVGVGLISAFAAREVFVSTLAIVFGSQSETEEGLAESLLVQMKKSTWPDGSPLFTVPSVAAILVFFLIALQCLSTFAIAQREMRSWTFAFTQLLALNAVAYLLAVMTYQSLHAIL